MRRTSARSAAPRKRSLRRSRRNTVVTDPPGGGDGESGRIASDRQGEEDRRRPAPGNDEPPRPRRGGDRNGKNGYAAGDRRTVERHRRPRFPRGRQGRPLRDPPSRREPPQGDGTRKSARTDRIPIRRPSRRFLGPLWGAGPPRPCHDIRPDGVREHLGGEHRHDPAEPPHHGTAGRGSFLRRTGDRSEGFSADGRFRKRNGQHPRRGQADAVAEAVRNLSPLPPVGAHRESPRGGGSTEADAPVLVRRGVSALRGRAEGAHGPDRAGRPAHPVQGGGRVLCDPEPALPTGNVLGQLGNRVQHALRAFTPKDQRAVKTAAETFRQNPKLDAVKAITELSVGEALVSVLDEKGTPTVVERALVYPPMSRLAPLTGRSAPRSSGIPSSRGATSARWTGSRPTKPSRRGPPGKPRKGKLPPRREGGLPPGAPLPATCSRRRQRAPRTPSAARSGARSYGGSWVPSSAEGTSRSQWGERGCRMMNIIPEILTPENPPARRYLLYT